MLFQRLMGEHPIEGRQMREEELRQEHPALREHIAQIPGGREGRLGDSITSNGK